MSAQSAGIARGDAPLIWNQRVACRTIKSTAFVYVGGRMVSLNEVGTRIWELFKDGATLASVSAAIALYVVLARKRALLGMAGDLSGADLERERAYYYVRKLDPVLVQRALV